MSTDKIVFNPRLSVRFTHDGKLNVSIGNFASSISALAVTSNLKFRMDIVNEQVKVLFSSIKDRDSFINLAKANAVLAAKMSYNVFTEKIGKRFLVLGLPNNLQVLSNGTNILKFVQSKLVTAFGVNDSSLVIKKVFGSSGTMLIFDGNLIERIGSQHYLLSGIGHLEIRKYPHVVFCKNCSKFGSDCVSCSARCIRCGGPHRATSCNRRNPICFNCSTKLSNKRNIGHRADDPQCKFVIDCLVNNPTVIYPGSKLVKLID
jgi:hypothetical protein